MARYIDTTQLLWLYEHECEKYSGLDEMVADVPTEDVVEVVRCKDCKNHEWCSIEDVALNDENFYCSWGERRDECEKLS